MVKFTIELPPVTKKNHSEILINRKTGKRFVAPSKQYRQYEKEAMWFIPRPEKPIDYPVNVKCLFYRSTRRRMDLTGAQQAVDDIMVKAGLLKDDCCDIVVGHDGSRVLYDKENPRTEVEITKEEV